jgi:hypothetical protein
LFAALCVTKLQINKSDVRLIFVILYLYIFRLLGSFVRVAWSISGAYDRWFSSEVLQFSYFRKTRGRFCPTGCRPKNVQIWPGSSVYHSISSHTSRTWRHNMVESSRRARTEKSIQEDLREFQKFRTKSKFLAILFM